MYRSLMSSSRIARTAISIVLALVFTTGVVTPAFAQTAADRRKVIATIVATAKSKHLSAADTKALLTLAKRESSYNPRARNGSCKGLFQLKTTAPIRRWANPTWNTIVAIGYIKRRYGTARKALAHSYRYGWY